MIRCTTETEYLRFDHFEPTARRKTWIVQVRARRQRCELGIIAWHSPWRGYTFSPYPSTVFSSGCLADIQACIADLMQERAEKRKEAKR